LGADVPWTWSRLSIARTPRTAPTALEHVVDLPLGIELAAEHDDAVLHVHDDPILRDVGPSERLR